MDNFELKISFELCFYLGFANLDNQTNKLLSVLTLHCTVYTLKRMDSRAILLMLPFVGALMIWIIKQTNTNIANQTSKLNKYNCTHFIQLQYVLDH